MEKGSWTRRGLRAHACGAWALLLALTLLGQAAPARAQTAAPAGSPPWHEIYRKAVADAELENWEGVVAKIGQAIRANPRSERNVRTYGMWHALYIPHYYLGLAQYHLGRGDEALRSLEKEEASGVVQHDPVAYLKLRRMIAAIKAGPRPAPPAAPAPAPSGTTAAPPPSKAAQPPADNVVEGLQAFFQGDYARSVTAFQEEMKRSPKDDLTLHLYLGMAYAGKASEDAAQKALWRNLAVLEFQRVHAIDPAYTLASGVFSEEMVEIFKEANRK